MNEKDFQDAIQQVLNSIDFLIENFKKNTTMIYNGIIVKSNTDGTWEVKFNGSAFNLKHHGNNVPKIGDNVKIFIPQGNYNLAFFM